MNLISFSTYVKFTYFLVSFFFSGICYWHVVWFIVLEGNESLCRIFSTVAICHFLPFLEGRILFFSRNIL
jgi:hypothetical protein